LGGQGALVKIHWMEELCPMKWRHLFMGGRGHNYRLVRLGPTFWDGKSGKVMRLNNDDVWNLNGFIA